MTFRQMVFKNFIANFRRYLVYYLCIFFSMTVFFLFTSIWFTPEFHSQTTPGIRQIILIGWIITLVFALLLVGYAHNQFSKTRLREFGILLSYGMLYGDIRKMVFIENSIIYIVSMISAFLTGSIFSKLFFMLTTNILEIKNISFSLTYYSYLLTSICFIPAFIMIIFLTLVKTRKLSVISMVKENRVSEMRLSGKWQLGVLGVLIVVSTLIELYYFNNNSKHVTLMKKSSLIAFVFCLIGIYLFINNGAILFYSYMKRKQGRYHKHILLLTEFSHKYKQNRIMIILISVLSFGAVMFTAMSYTLYSQSYVMVNKEQKYDVMFRESSALDYMSGIAYDKILSRGDGKVTQSAELNVVYLEAKGFPVESHRPNRWVPIISVKEYNQLFHKEYNIESGKLIVIDYGGEKDTFNQKFDEKMILSDGAFAHSFRKDVVIREKLFYRYAFGQPILLLVNSNVFALLNDKTKSINQGIIHLYQYDNWRKSGKAIEDLNSAFEDSYQYWSKLNPKEVQEINQKFYGFQVVSKYQQYEHNRQVGGFALFIMSFISLFFLVAICVLLYFKVVSDQESDKKKIFTLSTVGITSGQIKRYLYGKLKLLMVTPILLGSFIAIGFCISLNIGNTLEWDIANRTVLINAMVISLFYWAFLLLYYTGLKSRYEQYLQQYK